MTSKNRLSTKRSTETLDDCAHNQDCTCPFVFCRSFNAHKIKMSDVGASTFLKELGTDPYKGCEEEPYT